MGCSDMIDDRRKRPWKRLRVVVEVTVPPTSRATDKDLKREVENKLGYNVQLPNSLSNDRYTGVFRVKAFAAFWPVFKRIELGLKPHGRPANKKD